MNLHQMSKELETLFATTDYSDFLLDCEVEYNEVADDTTPTYTELSEIPDILETLGYNYTITDLDDDSNVVEANDDIILLYNKLASHNARYTFENASSLLYACQVLIKNHYEPVQIYIHGMTGHVSLLEQIVGSNGIEQLQWHKQFLDDYDIAIY